jgi:FAD/FMN-containing dehydrogenase
MKKLVGYLRAGLLTTWNIIVYMASGGNHLSLEGRVQKGVFKNWAGRYRYRPLQFAQPTTIEEIAGLVRQSRHVRVFGSGHSFNDGVVAEDALLSLDKYSGVIWRDAEKKQLAVKGGTRVRDVVKALHKAGWAFGALPSHDAQSMGGILSTDVHGTGRDWGFVSQSIVGLKIINGRGEIIECQSADPLFKAAIGGIGAVGIIAEVIVQGVDRFNVEQKVEVADLAAVEQELDRLIQANDHLSLYLFPFTDKCQVNTWNRTTRRQTFFGPMREFLAISGDALLASWGGDLIAYTGLLPTVSPYIHRVRKGTNLVLESAEAFNRNIYHAHQELEFAIPYAETFSACRRFIQLYEEMYHTRGRLPYTVFEVRFTPPGHDRTLLGPGQAEHCTWIDLVCNDSANFERYYAVAEKIAKEVGGRPHLGKYCQDWHAADLQRLYQGQFTTFQELIAEHDPEGKFTNSFTRRLFSLASNPTATDH